jgi:hypothetical protein
MRKLKNVKKLTVKMLMSAILAVLLTLAAGSAFGQGIGNLFQQGSGPIIQRVCVVPLFWGAQWVPNITNPNSPNPTTLQVATNINSIVTGPYMDGLAQYGVGRGSVQAIGPFDHITSSSEPPNPFTTNNVWNTVIKPALDSNSIPRPDDGSGNQYFYVVFMPPGANPGSNLGGFHTSYNYNGSQAHIAWVLNNGLGFITRLFSHELNEAVSDPEGSAYNFNAKACPGVSGWCEIGDVCQNLNGLVNGISVQDYWSQVDQACMLTEPPLTGPTSCGTLTPGQSLIAGTAQNTLTSCDGRFTLRLETDGELILDQKIFFRGWRNVRLWSSMISGPDNLPYSVTMQQDGNLVIYNAYGYQAAHGVWSSATFNNPGAVFWVQNDGNLVVYSKDAKPLWASNTCCH